MRTAFVGRHRYDINTTDTATRIRTERRDKGLCFLTGTIPLILALLPGLVLVGSFGTVACRPRALGPVRALFMVAISSLAGLVVAQPLWNGELFEMGTQAAMCG